MGQPHRHTAPLHQALAAAVRALAAAAEEHDGIEALGEQTLLDLADPDAAVVHLTTPGAHTDEAVTAGTTSAAGQPVLGGYAQVNLSQAGAPATVELVVAPDARRRGLGTALLASAREVAAEQGGVAVWAHGDLPGAQALAARAGLQVRRELWQMARDLGPDDAAAPPTPEGVTLRPFVVGQDEDAWLRVNARAFHWHPEQGRMGLRDLRARQQEPWFEPGDLLLAERDGTLVGSTWTKVEPGATDGELYVLAVDPGAQGLGLGRYLTAVTLHHLVTRGMRRVVLYTEATNTSAVRTYTSAGFTRSRVDVQYG